MRGAAPLFADRLREIGGSFDVLFASPYLDLACFLGLVGERLAGAWKIIYFHENQLRYPVQVEDKRPRLTRSRPYFMVSMFPGQKRH